MTPISNTDLILNPDGSIYHLHLLPEDIADTIILVGDPGRVKQVAKHFDQVDLEKANREFATITGIYKGTRISVLSTGIGTDNIDIVLNELDALVNVDLGTRTIKGDKRRLNLVRIGTSGALHADIPVGATIVTRIAGGFDGLYHFYGDQGHITIPGIAEAFMNFTGWKTAMAEPYFINGSDALIEKFASDDLVTGITLSTPGFYAPQVRSIRLSPFDETLIQKIGSFSFNNFRINNFEMESSALYALSKMLGHEAITICVAVANRISLEFLEDYKSAIDHLITDVLDKIIAND